MKAFGANTLLFLLIGITAYLSFSIVLNNRVISKHYSFKLPSDKSYLFLGHSHVECAVNDSIVGSALNMARSAESYFYTYIKLRNYIDENPNIKGVFIGYSNNNIESKMNNWLYEDKYLIRQFPDYHALFTFDEHVELLSYNHISYLRANGISLRKRKDLLIDNNFYRLGGYLYLERYKTESLLNLEQQELYDLYNQVGESDLNIKYLKRCVQLCKEKNMPLWLIRTPMHPKYPRNNEVRYKEVLKSLGSSIQFLDYSDYPIDNSEFGDFVHLNHLGAAKFSTFLDSALNNITRNH